MALSRETIELTFLAARQHLRPSAERCPWLPARAPEQLLHPESGAPEQLRHPERNGVPKPRKRFS